MAAGAWKIFHHGKFKLGRGDISLSGGIFNLTLHSIGASDAMLGSASSVFTEIGSQVTGGGYAAGGKTISNTTWAFSGNNVKFDSNDWIVTGSIASIKYAVLMQSISPTSGFVLAYSTLSATGFAVTGSNTLTVQMNASGIFTLA